MIKWIGVGLGTILGISHIGMIGYIATVNKEQGLPKLDIPVTPYTSYVVQANKDGYKLSYTANDPKTAFITKDIKEKAGFLGLANNTTQVTAVSNHRSWLDGTPGLTQQEAADITATRKSEACVKAIGSAEGTGRLVGTSIGASAAPSLATIPYIGWVAAGWVAMFGGDQGADIGGNMAEDLNKNC